MILLPIRSTFSLIASCSNRIYSKAACISPRKLDKKGAIIGLGKERR